MKDRRRRGFGSWLTKKSRQGYKVSGSRNRQPLDKVKCCHDTDCNESLMKKGFNCHQEWDGTWEELSETFRKKMKASECAVDMIEEAFEFGSTG